MDWQAIVAILVPTVAVIFYAGKQTQILKTLTEGFRDHESRLRNGGL